MVMRVLVLTQRFQGKDHCPGVSPKSPAPGVSRFSEAQSKPCEHPKPVPWWVPGWGAPSARGFPKSPVLSSVTPFFSFSALLLPVYIFFFPTASKELAEKMIKGGMCKHQPWPWHIPGH